MNLHTILSEPQGRLALIVTLGFSMAVVLALFFWFTGGEARFQAKNRDDEH
ncbi:MAG: hypothetical protein ACLQVD_08720 [Capsulimonadaceae bacterium]